MKQPVIEASFWIMTKNVIYSVYSSKSFTRRSGATTTNPTHREFIIHDDKSRTRREKLSVVYPKQTGAERRLYFSKRAGFEADEGYVWYIFSKVGDDNPHIGSMTSSDWEQLVQSLDTIKIVYPILS